MITISNAFSLQMLPEWVMSTEEVDPMETTLSITPIANPAAWLADAETRHGPASYAVGHEDTAAIFSGILAREVPVNRVSVVLDSATELLVGQYKGPRLPEGAKELPEGARIVWILVTFE